MRRGAFYCATLWPLIAGVVLAMPPYVADRPWLAFISVGVGACWVPLWVRYFDLSGKSARLAARLGLDPRDV
jgi:hypothetical protein